MSGLLRSNVVVASGTAISRVTGLLRIVVLGYVLGQTALTDAYLIANETPNIVYDLLLGGLLSATLVPLFSTFVEQDDDESTNVVLTVSVVLMSALTAVAVIAAPLIFGLYSVNVADGVDPDVYREVGTTLARIFLIQILFYGLTGLANAFLNSRRRFFAAAWSPILPNLVIIAFLLSLPNAIARWAGFDYALAAPLLALATLAVLVPRVRYAINETVYANLALRWSLMGFLILALLAGYFLTGPLAALGLILAQVFALVGAACLLDGRGPGARNPGPQLAFGLGLFVVLNFLNAFAFTYAYVLPPMRDLGWAVYLLAAAALTLGVMRQAPGLVPRAELAQRTWQVLTFGVVILTVVIGGLCIGILSPSSAGGGEHPGRKAGC